MIRRLTRSDTVEAVRRAVNQLIDYLASRPVVEVVEVQQGRVDLPLRLRTTVREPLYVAANAWAANAEEPVTCHSLSWVRSGQLTPDGHTEIVVTGIVGVSGEDRALRILVVGGA